MQPNNNHHYMNRMNANPNNLTNSYNNQNLQANITKQYNSDFLKTEASQLLPYHEYMAIQKRSSEQSSHFQSNQNNSYGNHYNSQRNQEQFNNFYRNRAVEQNYYGILPNFYSFPPNYQQNLDPSVQQITKIAPQNIQINKTSLINAPILKEQQNHKNNDDFNQFQNKDIQKKQFRNSNQLNNNKNYRHEYNFKKQQNKFKKQQNNNKIIETESDADGWSQQQQQQQLIYQKYQQKRKNYNKNKPIKKGDHITEDPQQIRKWIQARKKNYPGVRKRQNLLIRSKQQNCMNEQEKKQLSKLQMKIRKKLIIINGDSRSIMKKIRNIQLLKRIVQDPKILKKQKRTNYPVNKRQNKWNRQKIEKQKIIQQVKNKQIKNIFKLQDKQISQSEKSMQPQQIPLNKIPKYQIQKQQNQDKEAENPKFFEIVQKNEENLKDLKDLQKKSKKISHYHSENAKLMNPESIIAHLRQKQQQDRESLDKLFDYKSNSHSYRYRVKTLQTNLKLDDIFAETTLLLQAIRYIVKQDFFENKK